MDLQIVVPDRVVVDTAVEKVIAEAPDGSFCLKPRHIDFASPLAVGLLSYVVREPIAEGGERMDEPVERFVAVDEGLLVKCGERVQISVRRAVVGEDLEELRRTVREVYRAVSEEERDARRSASRLEASFVRRFLEIEER